MTTHAASGLLSAVAPAPDLGTFLERALTHVVRRAGCTGGSVFVYDPASAQLRLQLMFDAKTGQPVDRPLVELAPGEGIAGRAFRGRNSTLVVQQPELSRIFVRSSQTVGEHLRAIACARVEDGQRPRAVFCVDYPKHDGEPTGLSEEERGRFNAIAAEIGAPNFASAFQRMTFQQAVFDIQAAGHQPAALRHEVSAFLSQLRSAFASQRQPPPETAYLQLVDRRRGVIRTIHGFGLPLSFQLSVSHPLDCGHIQAVVVGDACPRLIAGCDPSFDPGVYDKYGHQELVRLWLPIFPFPVARMCARANRTVEDAVRSVLEWGDEECTSQYARRRATWRRGSAPPPLLVWGTLELGYKRRDLSAVTLEPFTTHLATFAVGQTYALIGRVFRATLAGALDSVGHALATASGGRRTRLTVAMPDWLHPQYRDYTGDATWPAAVPRVGVACTPSPSSPARVEFDGRVLPAPDGRGGETTEAERLLAHCAEVAVRAALRLDDYVSDQYVLLENGERKDSVGTHHPDPALPQVLGEICREAGAVACTYVPFERVPEATNLHPIAPPTSWPSDPASGERDSAREERMQDVARSGLPLYPDGASSAEKCDVLLPLELVDGVVAVVHLRFQPGTDMDDSRQRELEGRVVRWVHRLSLGRLVTSSRFAALMLNLRDLVGKERRAACGATGTRRLSLLAEALLNVVTARIGAVAAILTVPSRPTSGGPARVEHFWHVSTEAGGIGNIAVVGGTGNSDLKEVTELPPRHLSRHRGWIASICTEFQQRVEERRGAGEHEQARAIEQIAALMREESAPQTTMLLCPLKNAEDSDDDQQASLTLFLEGEHHLSYLQKRLMHEFGELVADALAQARGLDRQASLARHDDHLIAMRSQFGKTQTVTDLVGVLFGRMGHFRAGAAQDDCWGLADDAVLWIASDDGRELVARSGRGRGLAALRGRTVLLRRHHPLLLRLDRNPGANGDFELLIAENDVADKGSILTSYRTVGRWLLSFPLLDSDGRLAGIVDILLSDLPQPEESAVLEGVLRRLSHEFSMALEGTVTRSLVAFEQHLMQTTREALARLRSQDAYRLVAEAARDEFRASECDLYVERDGRMRMHTTTRVASLTDAERENLWIEEHASADPLAVCLSTKEPSMAHSRAGRPEREDLTHMSPQLAAMLGGDWQHERMVVHITLDTDASSGLLAVRGPVRSLPGHRGEPLKMSGHFNARQVRHLAAMGGFVQQTVAMAEAVERQSWFVDELQHTVGQPLQILRGTADEILRTLAGHGVPVRAFHAQLNSAFEVVHATRDRLAAFAKMSQVNAWTLAPVQLDQLVRDCCRLMQPAAHLQACTVDDGSVRTLPPVWVERTYIRVALLNLLDNAIKYSYKDKTITVSLTEHEGTVRLEVGNYGVGIPKADLARVFQPYFRSRVEDRGAPRRGGGIGLTMVKHAVEQIHCGKVIVSSRPPRDTTVGDSAASIANIPHTTTFSILLYRSQLDEIAHNAPESHHHE